MTSRHPNIQPIFFAKKKKRQRRNRKRKPGEPAIKPELYSPKPDYPQAEPTVPIEVMEA